MTWFSYMILSNLTWGFVEWNWNAMRLICVELGRAKARPYNMCRADGSETEFCL